MQHNVFKQRAYVGDKGTGQQVNIARDKTTVDHVGPTVSLCNNVINVWRR